MDLEKNNVAETNSHCVHLRDGFLKINLQVNGLGSNRSCVHLKRYPSQKGVHLRGVYLREVSISKRCLSILNRCPSYRGVHLREVSILYFICPS